MAYMYLFIFFLFCHTEISLLLHLNRVLACPLLACKSKVSAIDDSVEFRLGIRLNAQMDQGKLQLLLQLSGV